jgi:hypothetical protein
MARAMLVMGSHAPLLEWTVTSLQQHACRVPAEGVARSSKEKLGRAAERNREVPAPQPSGRELAFREAWLGMTSLLYDIPMKTRGVFSC